MRCPFCKSNKVKVVKEDLIVVDDEDATGGRTSPNGLVYDEGIFHYECENKHVFFGADPNIAEKNAEILSLAARSLQDEVGTGLRIDSANVEKVMPPDEPS